MVIRPIVTRITLASLVSAAGLGGLAVVGTRVAPPIGTVPLLEPAGRLYWFSGLVACVLSALVFQGLDRTPQLAQQTAGERRLRYEPVAEWPTAWVLPLATLGSCTLLLATYHSFIAGLAIVLFGFLLLLIGQLARLGLYGSDARIRQVARLTHTLVLYGIAFVAFAMIYVHKLRTLYSAPMIFAMAALLTLQLTEGADMQIDRRVLYAIVGGLVMAEATWVLNYWPATGWLGGGVLLTLFHLIAGIVLARVERTLSWRTVVEFGATALVALVIVVWGTLRSRGGI